MPLRGLSNRIERACNATEKVLPLPFPFFYTALSSFPLSYLPPPLGFTLERLMRRCNVNPSEE